jgi:hypothetical protein
MAIVLTDFDKIWASTSPLTPYSFSDSNYKEGWNFIGSTPPARQMWDYIQNFNDSKMKFIVDNFLPLSGGTMTGAIEGNPLTLNADDGNGNSASLVLSADGSATWNGHNVVAKNDEDITSSVTLTSTNATITGKSFHKVGNIVQAVISLRTSSAVNSGDNVNCTISGHPAPVTSINSAAYVSDIVLVTFLNGSSLTIRVIGRTLNAGSSFSISLLYATVG